MEGTKDPNYGRYVNYFIFQHKLGMSPNVVDETESTVIEAFKIFMQVMTKKGINNKDLDEIEKAFLLGG